MFRPFANTVVRCGPVMMEREPSAVELARQNMERFDRLSPEVREAFRESLFGVPVHVYDDVLRRGPNDAVKKSLRDRGLFPCDVGTDGVVIETIRQLDASEGQRLRSEATR